jgi:hypothetical protein
MEQELLNAIINNTETKIYAVEPNSYKIIR